MSESIVHLHHAVSLPDKKQTVHTLRCLLFHLLETELVEMADEGHAALDVLEQHVHD